MKTRFFLCMRPPVIETDDGSSYTTLSGRRNRRRKSVADPDKCIGQLSIKSNTNSLQKDSQSSPNITTPVSEPHILKSVSLTLVNGRRKSNSGSGSGACIMVSSLFFTMFFGKILGIVCTLILVCSICPHRKNDVSGVSENMVVKWPEKGSPEENNKRVIMAGLLERKSHYR